MVSDSIDVKLAVLEERVRRLDERLDQDTRGIDTIRDQLTALQQQADRWKMGLVVLAALGGIITWVLTSAETISKLLGRK